MYSLGLDAEVIDELNRGGQRWWTLGLAITTYILN